MGMRLMLLASDAVSNALELTWKGMLVVFIAIGLIVLITKLVNIPKEAVCAFKDKLVSLFKKKK